MILPTLAPPWEATLTHSQHDLVLFFLGFGALALFTGFVRTYVSRGEVGVRYRAATVARLGVMGVAALAYGALLVGFLVGYDAGPTGWVPNEFAVNAFSGRYLEWSLTVPLLCAELLAVTTLVGAAARRSQFLAMGFAFAMIFSGFLGAVVFGRDGDARVTLIWFLASAIFWVLTNIVLVRALVQSLPSLTAESAALLRTATLFLLGGWIIYPAVSLIQVLAFGGGWTTTMQVALCVADVTIKVGFGGMIHRVAKLRTAEDVRTGVDMHPEAVWINSVKQSDAGSPLEVFLPEASKVHESRRRPAGNWARGLTDDEARDVTSGSGTDA